MTLGNPSTDSQTDSRPRVLISPVQLPKGPEELTQVLLVKADSIVFHLQSEKHPVRRLRNVKHLPMYPDDRRHTFPPEVEGIVD
jgi:hypothetical protein